MLEGKDKTIAALNRNIDKLQHELDALSHHDDYHNQDNPLQIVVDQLTAKNQELEAKLI